MPNLCSVILLAFRQGRHRRLPCANTPKDRSGSRKATFADAKKRQTHTNFGFALRLSLMGCVDKIDNRRQSGPTR